MATLKTDAADLMGRTLRFEGYDYTITAASPSGTFRFARPDGLGEGGTPKLYGFGLTADLRDSGEGWLFLPHRVAPRLRPALEDLARAKNVEAALIDSVTRAIHAHPAYLEGRDDLARTRVLAAFNLTEE